jgi:methylisocitrate lyase
MTKASDHRKRLKALLAAPGTRLWPGCYDALTAKIAEQAGFDTVYVGSYATAASRFGLPDVGLVSLPDMVAHAQSVVDAVSVPVVADAENGWGHAANIWQAVRAFERAGVSAIHIEDHEFGKHTNVKPVLLSPETMVQKIRAALEAREDPDFMIIARSDAAWAWKDPDEAARRIGMYADAGADLVFPAGIHVDKLAPRRAAMGDKPLVITNKPGATLADEGAAGAKAVIYYGVGLYAAYRGVKNAFEALRAGGDMAQLKDMAADFTEFEQFIGYPEFEERASRYGLNEP